MRIIHVTIFFLLSLSSFAQDWTFHKADKSSKHRYEYWFRFENIEDSCSYLLQRDKGLEYSKVSLLNNKREQVLFANIELKIVDSDSIETLYPDSKGIVERILKPGKYNLKVNSFDYDKFELEFVIKENENIDLQISLGLAPDLYPYQINSKKKLTDYEIREIINCVKLNIQKGTDINCSEKNKYVIVRQI